MPQIRCPNCGMTINLESRKQIDIDLITSVVGNGPKTFTDILKATRLPRKTLCLRLKELCKQGTLVKKNGNYALNADYKKSDKIGRWLKIKGFPDMQRATLGVILMTLLIGSPIAFQVLATFLNAPSQGSLTVEPVILGKFRTSVSVYAVEDLYAWQVVMRFNQSQLKILEVLPGGFVGESYLEDFVYNVRKEEGLLLICGFLLGPVGGKSGSGLLTSIVFGYVVEDFIWPELVYEGKPCTLLLDSNEQKIDFAADDTDGAYLIINHENL